MTAYVLLQSLCITQSTRSCRFSGIENRESIILDIPTHLFRMRFLQVTSLSLALLLSKRAAGQKPLVDSAALQADISADK